MAENPLAKHFRQPAIYIKLPSGGKFWPEGTLNMPLNRELPIFPMTARDEITIKTPDALLNGSSVVNVIQSCCPNISDAWQMPSVDIDALLIAIRIASYGQNLPIETDCPECKEHNRHEVDLSELLDNQTNVNFDNPLIVDELTFKLRPQPYFKANQTNQITFEQNQAINLINDPNVDEDAKKIMFDKHVQKIVEISMSSLAASTESITMNDGEVVNDPEFIREYYTNTNARTIRTVQKHLTDITAELAIKPFQLKCGGCEKSYSTEFTFDYANFFDSGF